MRSSTLFVAAALLAAVAFSGSPVSAGQSNPIALTAGTTLSGQFMNATSGNFYTYSVGSTQLSSLYQYFFRINVPTTALTTNQLVTLQAYWQLNGVWYALTPTTWYTLSIDGVASYGYFSLSIDAKALNDQYTSTSPAPASILIGFSVTVANTVPVGLLNAAFSVTLTEHVTQIAFDSKGDIGSGSGGTILTDTCPGTATRCQTAASMSYHDHVYLMAAVTATAGSLVSAKMRNAETFSVDDTEYFSSSTNGYVYPRTCALTNSSCDIANAYYYVEVQAGSSANSDTTYTTQYSTHAGAHTTAAVSLLTVAAAAALAIFASRDV